MNDTIVAISTALGVGAISIIRLSGKDSINIVNKMFDGTDLNKVNTHTINYGVIKENNKKIDEVLVSVMKSPRTFTTEDIVEINCHGGITTTKKVLELALNNGARLAEPGEFTKRAFLNGRIDLTESEAVMDLIESKTESARVMAMQGLMGSTSNLIKEFRQNLKDLLSGIEVNIDYPEYLDIEVITLDKIKEQLKIMKTKLQEIIKESENSKIIKEGIKTLIIGRPNVGKSSILNKMLEEDKAIVTSVAGTTRDIVEGQITLDGILLNMIDTAGIRDTEDIVEKIGVEKSLSLINEADLVIIVLNGEEELTKEDLELIEKAHLKPAIVVLNKNDLKQNIDKSKINNKNIVSTNTNSIDGIKDLKEKIKELFDLETLTTNDFTYLTNSRQISLAKKAYNSLIETEEALNNEVPIDMLSINLKESLDYLGEIIGEVYSDEIIDNLFEKFCVGK